jgi:glycosyltransferase involved in cell wall biosynthesis
MQAKPQAAAVRTGNFPDIVYNSGMTLSIVVPARNEEKNIEWMLKQLHDNLTEIDHEIILSDDASTDMTREIAAKYAKVVPHIFQGKSTIAANRNNGARAATGDYIAFIDADIFVVEPNHFFKTLLADFAAIPNLVGATVKIEILPEQASMWDRLILWIANEIRRMDNNTLHKGIASGEFQMIKRAVFEKLHGYNEFLPIAEDLELFERLSKEGRTYFDWGLKVYTINRRSKELGWERLLWLWGVNYIYMKFLKRSYSKEWPPAR